MMVTLPVESMVVKKFVGPVAKRLDVDLRLRNIPSGAQTWSLLSWRLWRTASMFLRRSLAQPSLEPLKQDVG